LQTTYQTNIDSWQAFMADRAVKHHVFCLYNCWL